MDPCSMPLGLRSTAPLRPLVRDVCYVLVSVLPSQWQQCLSNHSHHVPPHHHLRDHLPTDDTQQTTPSHVSIDIYLHC